MLVSLPHDTNSPPTPRHTDVSGFSPPPSGCSQLRMPCSAPKGHRDSLGWGSPAPEHNYVSRTGPRGGRAHDLAGQLEKPCLQIRPQLLPDIPPHEAHVSHQGFPPDPHGDSPPVPHTRSQCKAGPGSRLTASDPEALNSPPVTLWLSPGAQANQRCKRPPRRARGLQLLLPLLNFSPPPGTPPAELLALSRMTLKLSGLRAACLPSSGFGRALDTQLRCPLFRAALPDLTSHPGSSCSPQHPS